MINVRAKNFTLTEAIETYAVEKIGKFGKYVDKGQDIDIELDANKNRQKVEIFFTSGKELFKVSERHDDLYAAIDLVADKMKKTLRRHKEKIQTKSRESIRYGDFPKMPEAKAVQTEEAAEEKPKTSGDPRIVRRKTISVKPMFEEEAIMQMDLLDHNSFIFFNADTETVSMLYKRHDGNYGIIES